MIVAGHSDVGLIRDQNEDRFVARETLIAVADGMGGHAAGEVAAEIACDVLARYALQQGEDEMAKLQEAVEIANLKIIARSQGEARLSGMGTTLTCASVVRGTAYLAHVGDSRAYLIRDGTIARLTEDHSVVGDLVREGRLSERQAMVHPYRNVLTRALGTHAQTDADYIQLDVVPGDVLVLCTDGLTGLVEDCEVLGVVEQCAAPDQAASRLVELANARGGTDNTTVVVGCVTNDDRVFEFLGVHQAPLERYGAGLADGEVLPCNGKRTDGPDEVRR